MPTRQNVLSIHKAILLTMMLSCLSGCATLSGNCSSLPLVEYPPQFKELLAGEILTAGNATKRFVRESINLRDAVRACKGEK